METSTYENTSDNHQQLLLECMYYTHTYMYTSLYTQHCTISHYGKFVNKYILSYAPVKHLSPSLFHSFSTDYLHLASLASAL